MQLLLDSQLHLAAWGSSIAVAFPTAEDAQAFASGVCQVAVKEVSLADSSAAAALACTLACSGAAPAPQSCPPSPARADKALVGGKRKAAEAGLMTPLVKVSGARWAGARAVRGQHLRQCSAWHNTERHQLLPARIHLTSPLPLLPPSTHQPLACSPACTPWSSPPPAPATSPSCSPEKAA